MDTTTVTPMTFGKDEKLCSKLLIDRLFMSHSSSFVVWPMRAVFLLVDTNDESDAGQVEVLISVSKRYFKRAVKRNRVKRQIREAYRKHKPLLTEAMASVPGKKLLLAFVWQEAHLQTSEKIEHRLQTLLLRLAEKLATAEG